MATENDIFISQWMKWVTICLSLSICGLLLLVAMNRRSSGSGDQEDLHGGNAASPIIDVTDLLPMPKAKGRAKAKTAPKKKPESNNRVGYLIEEEYATGQGASSSASGSTPSAPAVSTGIGYGRGGLSSMTPGQAVSSRGRKITQIMIKPEAADASTQTSQADLEAAPPPIWSHPSSSAPAAGADEPQESAESRRARRKAKRLRCNVHHER